MKIPTIQEVRARIIEKGWLTVSAKQFMDVNEGNEWEKKDGTPIKHWKGVLATWYHNSLKYGENKKICRTCKKYGDYPDTDDTGQQYWLCEEHKPRRKTSLPAEYTDIMKASAKPEVNPMRRAALIQHTNQECRIRQIRKERA